MFQLLFCLTAMSYPSARVPIRFKGRRFGVRASYTTEYQWEWRCKPMHWRETLTMTTYVIYLSPYILSLPPSFTSSTLFELVARIHRPGSHFRSPTEQPAIARPGNNTAYHPVRVTALCSGSTSKTHVLISLTYVDPLSLRTIRSAVHCIQCSSDS
jgi:hypothetical protein